MKDRISRFGVGPRIIGPAVIYCIAAWAATARWPIVFKLPLPDFLRAIGIVLIACGVILWLIGIVAVMRAYGRDELMTTGVFALVRHPVYSAWMTLIFPGLALLAGSWPMFLAPLIAYAIFKRLIVREDEYLAKRFGQAYAEYRRRVREIIPSWRIR